MRSANDNIIPRQPGDNPCHDTLPMLVYIIKCVENKLYDNKYLQFVGNTPKNISVKESHDSKEQPKINEHLQLHNDTNYILSALNMFRHIEHVEIHSAQQIITDCNNTVENRVKYITNDVTKEEFVDVITLKDMKRKKHTDILYIYDLIRTIGKDTINAVFGLIDNQMQLSRSEVLEVIMGKSVVEIKEHFRRHVTEITKFIEYCNKQFDIIGVSHNCSSKHLLLTNQRTYVNFRHLKLSTKVDQNLLTVWMNLNVVNFKSKPKSTIKKIKESYSKM
jgi:hypothetical protein